MSRRVAGSSFLLPYRHVAAIIAEKCTDDENAPNSPREMTTFAKVQSNEQDGTQIRVSGVSPRPNTTFSALSLAALRPACQWPPGYHPPNPGHHRQMQPSPSPNAVQPISLSWSSNHSQSRRNPAERASVSGARAPRPVVPVRAQAPAARGAAVVDELVPAVVGVSNRDRLAEGVGGVGVAAEHARAVAAGAVVGRVGDEVPRLQHAGDPAQQGQEDVGGDVAAGDAGDAGHRQWRADQRDEEERRAILLPAPGQSRGNGGRGQPKKVGGGRSGWRGRKPYGAGLERAWHSRRAAARGGRVAIVAGAAASEASRDDDGDAQ